MRSFAALLALLLITATIPRVDSAQDESLIVAFVTGHVEGSYLDTTLSGFSRLANIFTNAGAHVQEITLDTPIDPEIDIIILAGPKRPPVSDAQMSRVWSFVERGGSLLVLADPFPVRGFRNSSLLNQLLWQDYGIQWRDDMLVEDWFGRPATEVVSFRGYLWQPRRLSALTASPIAGHPLTDVIYRYRLPVYYWQGRSLQVQSPALHGDAFPLLATTGNPYGEVNMVDGLPMRNIGEDHQGRLILGAAVEDRQTGSRIVVIGDSDLLKNGYGLEFANPELAPLYSGNTLFAQAVVRWLLRQSPTDLDLHPAYTWISLDGEDNDWVAIPALYQDENYTVKLARTDRSTYFLLDMANPDDPITGIIIDTRDSAGDTRRTILGTDTDVVRIFTNLGEANPIANPRLVVGDVIEARIPLQALPQGVLYTVVRICIIGDELDCIDSEIPRQNLWGLEPRGQYLLPGIPTARVNIISGTVIRSVPDGTAIDTLENGLFVNILEETDFWLRVRGETIEGWVPRAELEFPYE